MISTKRYLKSKIYETKDRKLKLVIWLTDNEQDELVLPIAKDCSGKIFDRVQIKTDRKK